MITLSSFVKSYRTNTTPCSKAVVREWEGILKVNVIYIYVLHLQFLKQKIQTLNSMLLVGSFYVPVRKQNTYIPSGNRLLQCKKTILSSIVKPFNMSLIVDINFTKKCCERIEIAWKRNKGKWKMICLKIAIIK